MNRNSVIRHVALCCAFAAVLVCPPRALAQMAQQLCATPTASFQAQEGFGPPTTGGKAYALNPYTVTNLAASGPGTLADAVSQGNRYIVFGVAGTITLTQGIMVKGANITIDGCYAPSPGITLQGAGLYIHGILDPYPVCTDGAGKPTGCDVHNIIVRNLRTRSTVDDGFRVAYGAYNIVFDRVSAQGAGDGSVDITEHSHDVTVSWSIFAHPAKKQLNSLLAYNEWQITMHHNLFTKAIDRNPDAAYDYNGNWPPSNQTTLDFWNNLIWDWDIGRGSLMWYHSQDNVVNNYYYAPSIQGRGDNLDALIVCSPSVPRAHEGDCYRYNPLVYARAYVAGNFNPALPSINAVGTEPVAFPGQTVTEDACTAAQKIAKGRYSVTDGAGAGAYPLDSVDQSYLSPITLPGCP